MNNIFVTSLQEKAGKTTLCIGLIGHFNNLERKISYLKPLSSENGPDKDCTFIKDAFGLAEPLDKLCPFTFTPGQPDIKELAGKVVQHMKEIGQTSDITVIEGISLSADGAVSSEIVKASAARVVAVINYQPDLPLDKYIEKLRALGGNLAGLVFNKIPPGKIPAFRQEVTAKLSAGKIDILGFIPEDRTLLSMTVGQLAEALSGKILNNPEASEELVENIMVGAMTVGSALDYFVLKENKAVITRGDRPDIQHAALATSTRCIVLTGNKPPVTRILTIAKEQKIPLILVEQDTPAVLEKLSAAGILSGIWNKNKISAVNRLVEQNLNLSKLQ